MLLFATFKTNSMTDMNKAKGPAITLGSIDNKMTHPGPGGHIECLINGKEIGSIDSGEKGTLNTVLCTPNDRLPLIRRVALEPRHPMQKGFREFRLKLEIESLHLKIVKDFSDGTQRPLEFYGIEDGKKYLLNLIVQRADGADEVVANLVEENNAPTPESS